MNGLTLLLIVIGAGIGYFAGKVEGYQKALEDIFADAPLCPHGQDWDHCPDCCH